MGVIALIPGTPSVRIVANLLMLVVTATGAVGCREGEDTGTASWATEVIEFHPDLPEGEEVAGECFSSSLAVARPRAYRCSVGNAIHDPCFAVEEEAATVICGANPVEDENGFVMRVAGPLPVETSVPNPAHGWLVLLTDGTVCGYNTGATRGFDDERLNYGCDDASWILGELQLGDVWTARRVTVSDDGSEIAESEIAQVKTVWR